MMPSSAACHANAVGDASGGSFADVGDASIDRTGQNSGVVQGKVSRVNGIAFGQNFNSRRSRWCAFAIPAVIVLVCSGE